MDNAPLEGFFIWPFFFFSPARSSQAKNSSPYHGTFSFVLFRKGANNIVGYAQKYVAGGV
jgi:hypothetical protein